MIDEMKRISTQRDISDNLDTIYGCVPPNEADSIKIKT